MMKNLAGKNVVYKKPTIKKSIRPKVSIDKKPMQIEENSRFTVEELQNGLEKYFGFRQFKGLQLEAIQSLMTNKDTFVIMPTGGGKSLCYQLPAMMCEGVAIIVSPLIALMKNQVDLFRGYSSNDNIAHFLNSTLNKGQQREVKDDLISGNTKMLFVAPETL